MASPWNHWPSYTKNNAAVSAAPRLAKASRNFKPLAEEEERRLLELFRPQAGRLAFYRGEF